MPHSVALERLPIILFFFNDTATTEIYTLSLHDALPIYQMHPPGVVGVGGVEPRCRVSTRSEEHTSEVQSPCNLVCRLLLEKKSTTNSVAHGETGFARISHCPGTMGEY